MKKTEWMDRALCARPVYRDDDIDWSPGKESARGLALVKPICEICPVRVACLKWAMEIGTDGYWGGVDRASRKRLAAIRTRASCPICKGKNFREGPPNPDDTIPVVCGSCGFSWRRPGTPPPVSDPDSHTCNGPVFGRLTAGCPRCDELKGKEKS